MDLRALTSRLTSVVSFRGGTSSIPAWFAGSLIAASIVDLLAAVVSLYAQPDGNVGAAATIASVFIRPGVFFVLMAVVLAVATVVGWSADDRALASGAGLGSSRRTPAATIAGWVSTVGGVGLAGYLLFFVYLLWSAALEFPAGERPGDVAIHAMAVGVGVVVLAIAAVPVWLGIQVLRHRSWARLALIAFCVLAKAGEYAIPVLKEIPLFGVAVVVVPVLLLWAELRDRGVAGSFRDCARGLTLFLFNVALLFIYLQVTTVGDGVPEIAPAALILNVGLPVYYVVAVLLAMWAANRDANELWSGLNAVVVIGSPLLISLAGLLTTIATDVMGWGS